MALYSPTKTSDLEFLAVWADIIEMTYNNYKRTNNPEVKEYLDGFIETYNELKKKISTHDYTKEDTSYWHLEKFHRETQLSPVG